jgi:type II restriction/modification system DNA methylase subunit YeeA
MNKAKLKSYAPQARLDFIAAVTARANLLGLSEKAGQLEVAPAQTQGDVTLIAGQAWPAKVAAQREQLVARMRREGFAQTCDAIAYTWFNRFAALRYMELHDYLGHGHRALSSAESKIPDILTHASELAHAGDTGLPGLKAELVTEMKLAGNRDGELYRMLLVAQCNALSTAMPFLFERIDDDSELLLPDNLLRSDSVIAKLVEEIPEEDWAEVEIIGWLYQFYISDKKDQVIGKVVKSEDIPAATQLFTPNWIVQYLVQNSIGRLWLMANPQSTLAKDWPYYITPAEQAPEVQSQLDALTQTRVREDGDTLNPESITVLDPACGSGHILVVAYDVLKAIYLERGYQPRAIPRLILEKNLYGLDIDDRAAQMAGFALMMKARADDRRLFNEPIKLNVLSLQESKGLDPENLTQALQAIVNSGDQSEGGAIRSEFLAHDLFPESHQQGSLSETNPQNDKNKNLRLAIATLLKVFGDAKTYGSLIEVPTQLSANLLWIRRQLESALQGGDLYAQSAAQDLMPLINQALILGMKFDSVIANPPYMGSKGMNPALKDYAKVTFPDSKSDLFAMFMERGFEWCKPSGFNSMVTMQSWMFLSSYEAMRKKLLRERTIQTMAHLGARAFTEISGEVVQTTAFCMSRFGAPNFFPTFFRLTEGDEGRKNSDLLKRSGCFKTILQSNLLKIPGYPVSYWITPSALNCYVTLRQLSDLFEPKAGISTGANGRFISHWWEHSSSSLFIFTDKPAKEKVKFFPHNKGGEYRRWYGNTDFVLRYDSDAIREMEQLAGFRHDNSALYFQPSVSWSKITSSGFCARAFPRGYAFDSAGISIFPDHPVSYVGLLNSNSFSYLTSFISPTLNFTVGDISRVPVPTAISDTDTQRLLISIFEQDWASSESSHEFKSLPLMRFKTKSLLDSYLQNELDIKTCIQKVQSLESNNNQLFINAYGLQDDLSSEVPESQITLTRADREKDSQRLISYAIGCMMGRYSLDEPGLIYAHAGNADFNPGRYSSFPADADGIIPITDELWFDEDASNRIREFLCTVWSPDTLEENMLWLAESLGAKAGETSDETIRRYIADRFFKDHLQTYKKRPIYWLFSSGKQGAFQALVYLHRYNEGTLARMRAEYVVPLTSKIQSRIEMLEKDVSAASSTAARNKLAKELERLKKKHVELLAYDEQLRHYADMRINLSLDDGVKVNYGKFGDLLAEVKAVTGGAADE